METAATEQPKGSASLVDIEQESLSIRQEIGALVITNQETYDLAVEKRVQATAWLKNAREFFKGMKDPAYAAWKKICSNENLVCDPTEAAIKKINRALLDWDQEQERLRRAEQARIEEEARKRAEEQRLADAIHMEDQGMPEEVVEEMLAAPVVTHTPVVAAPTYEKSKAVVYKDNWKGQCTDLHALVKAAAKDKNLLGLLMVNQPALNSMAKALKETMSVPGCKALNDRIVSSGRG